MPLACMCSTHVLARCVVCSSVNVCKRAICTVLLDECSRPGEMGQVYGVSRMYPSHVLARCAVCA